MRYIRLFIVILILVVLPVTVLSAENFVRPSDPTDLDMSMSIVCLACHERIHEEWSGSMHSKSTPEKDPIVGSFYRYLSQKKIDTANCDRCHSAMNYLFRDVSDRSSEVFKEGVSCYLCHAVNGRIQGKEGMGADAYILDFVSGLNGPTEVKNTKYHETAFRPIFRETEFCTGCHQEGEAEYAPGGAKKLACQYCHMPSKQREKSATGAKTRDKVFRHYFEGGHSQEILQIAAIVSGEPGKGEKGIQLKVTVENSAVHKVPIGFPLRAVYLKVSGMNNNGEVVWTNYRSDPLAEDPKSYFALILPKGEEALAHFVKKTGIEKDQRLGPSESRELGYFIPSREMTRVKMQLYYRLLPVRVMKEIGIDERLAPEVLMTEEIVELQL